MTTAEQFRQQGLEQGWEQGSKHCALRSAKRLLEFGMPLTDISIVVELPVTDLMPLMGIYANQKSKIGSPKP